MPGGSRGGGRPWSWIRRHDTLVGLGVGVAVLGAGEATGHWFGSVVTGIALLTTSLIRRKDPARTPEASPPGLELPHTRRLLLRRLRYDDLDRLDALNNEPDVMRYLDWRPPTRDEVEAELRDVRDDYARWPAHGRFAAETRQGTFVGWFALRIGEDALRPELGFRLRPTYWGKGIATEGARALVGYGFGRGAAAIVAETMVVNAASRRVLEKAGMRPEWFFHERFTHAVPGSEQGEVRYAITRAEWESERAGRSPRAS